MLTLQHFANVKASYKTAQLVRKLRYRYEGDKARQERLTRLVNTIDHESLAIQCREFRRRSKARQRLRAEVERIVEGGRSSWLVTLTFNDETLAATTSEIRRKEVRKYLTARFERFVACIDYGAQNAREHYHALVSTRKEGGKGMRWSLGFEHYSRTYSSAEAGKYALKASSYAVKSGAKQIHSPR